MLSHPFSSRHGVTLSALWLRDRTQQD